MKLNSPYGPLHLDANRQAILNVFYQQLYLKDGKLAIKTVGEVPGVDPDVRRHVLDQARRRRAAPSRPARSGRLPWIGKETHPEGHRLATR